LVDQKSKRKAQSHNSKLKFASDLAFIFDFLFVVLLLSHLPMQGLDF
jgi:hypothetical protein